MSIFSHVLIVMSGTSLVPYGFYGSERLLGDCSMLSFVYCGTQLPHFILFLSLSVWVEVIVASFC